MLAFIDRRVMARSFSMETAVRGYHVYSSVWNARCGEVLYCERELDNPEDEFAVAVKLQDLSQTTVGYLPREISRLAWHFMRHGGRITCRVTSGRRRSPIVQGGLEIPCIAEFSVAQTHQSLLERLIEQYV